MYSEKFPINGFNNLFITLNYIASIVLLFPNIAAIAARAPAASTHTHTHTLLLFIWYFVFTLSIYIFVVVCLRCFSVRDALLSDYILLRLSNGCASVCVCASAFVLLEFHFEQRKKEAKQKPNVWRTRLFAKYKFRSMMIVHNSTDTRTHTHQNRSC